MPATRDDSRRSQQFVTEPEVGVSGEGLQGLLAGQTFVFMSLQKFRVGVRERVGVEAGGHGGVFDCLHLDGVGREIALEFGDDEVSIAR